METVAMVPNMQCHNFMLSLTHIPLVLSNPFNNCFLLCLPTVDVVCAVETPERLVHTPHLLVSNVISALVINMPNGTSNNFLTLPPFD